MHCQVCRINESGYFARVDQRDYWRCRSCDATFLQEDQRPALADEHAHYHLHQNGPGDSAYRTFLSRLAQPLLDLLPPSQHGLDYGCGPGPALAEMLTEAGHRMTVYDPLFFNDKAALTCQYDFITCSEVVEHFHHPAEQFSILDNLLRRGGWLGIMTGFLTDDIDFVSWHYRRDPTHVVFYRETTFQALARQYQWHYEIPCPNVVLFHKPLVSLQHPKNSFPT